MKEGMKVRLTEETSYFNKGDVGVVKLADDDNTSLIEVKGETWWVANGKLEEVKSMKIGDKVRIIDDRNCCFKNGDVGVVIDTDESTAPIKVRRDEDTAYQWFKEEQLELIQNHNFKKNDKVVVVDTTDTSFDPGDVGDIEEEVPLTIYASGKTCVVKPEQIQRLLNKGDKVRVVTEGLIAEHYFNKGDVGVIIEVDDYNTTLPYRVETPSYRCWVRHRDVEPCTEPEPKYQTRPISYDGCHPVIAENLKRGEMILCNVWDDIKDNSYKRWVCYYIEEEEFSYGVMENNIYKHAEPVIQKQVRVKKASEIVKWLEENGYTPDVQTWRHEKKMSWNCTMFRYCGKKPTDAHIWLPEWLEEV